MDQISLQSTLEKLIAEWENEVVEFKQASDSYPTSDIGKYFSALSNEANLSGAENGWLIFGVENKSRSIIGTDYRMEPERLQSLKMQIAQNTDPSVPLRNIHELPYADHRVLMFQIPPAPRGMPIAWNGHYYARAGESLTSLSLDKLDEIRKQTINIDWTAQVVHDASIRDLDIVAISKARESFCEKYANRFSEDIVNGWSLETFLERARLTQGGKLTRATLLLLGKPESTYLLSPHPAQLTWKLVGPEQAYEHFGLPFLLSTTQLYQKIRNIQLRLLPENQLVPIEVAKYDQKVVLEALHNCIAHQDYSLNGRIIVTEKPDQLVFENLGNFYEGQPAEYIAGTKTPLSYRNPFLVQAMVELNMIDTMGYGIHAMHVAQARRYFPMPDYDLSETGAVKMTIFGGVVDPAYSQLLMQKTDLPLIDILALDRVQKKLPLPDDAIKHLRKAGLIEGRKPNLYVSAVVAGATASKADYIRTRAQDDDFYAKLVMDYIHEYGHASRKEIDSLLLPKLSEVLTPQQKINKVNNLITKMRTQGRIHNTGSARKPNWVLQEEKE